MSKERRSALVALGVALLAICVFVPLSSTAEMISFTPTGTLEIDGGGSGIVSHFRAEELAVVSFAFNVTEGGAVDVLLLDEVGYEIYRLGSDTSTYLDGSVLNASWGLGTIDDLVPGQEYYLLIDNSASPLGGGDPTGNVVVEYGFQGQNIVEISDQSTLILVILILVILVFFVVVIMLVRSHRAEREPGASVHGLGRKYCPNCGEIVETYVHKCPRCGHEW